MVGFAVSFVAVVAVVAVIWRAVGVPGLVTVNVLVRVQVVAASLKTALLMMLLLLASAGAFLLVTLYYC